jgi:hypothetical protein
MCTKWRSEIEDLASTKKFLLMQSGINLVAMDEMSLVKAEKL